MKCPSYFIMLILLERVVARGKKVIFEMSGKTLQLTKNTPSQISYRNVALLSLRPFLETCYMLRAKLEICAPFFPVSDLKSKIHSVIQNIAIYKAFQG